MKSTILIFEDNTSFANSLQLLINTSANLQCPAVFPNPTGILDIIEKHKPDVLLMDIDMPQMTGIEAVKMVRAKHPDLHIIMQTIFDDGEKSQRKWVIKSLGNNRYSGTAPDVIGVAQGEARGNALRWSYVLQVPYKGSTIDLTLDDWMFLAEDDVMINRATMSKFGVKVGEIVISFKK